MCKHARYALCAAGPTKPPRLSRRLKCAQRYTNGRKSYNKQSTQQLVLHISRDWYGTALYKAPSTQCGTALSRVGEGSRHSPENFFWRPTAIYIVGPPTTVTDCVYISPPCLGKACCEACPTRLIASGVGLSGGCKAGFSPFYLTVR